MVSSGGPRPPAQTGALGLRVFWVIHASDQDNEIRMNLVRVGK